MIFIYLGYKYIIQEMKQSERIIKASFKQVLLADPTVVTPEESPDNMWHLYAHSAMGIEEYISKDYKKWIHNSIPFPSTVIIENKRFSLNNGVTFSLISKIIVNTFFKKTVEVLLNLRPFVLKDNGIFYLYFQKLSGNFLKGKLNTSESFINSKILCSTSKDLVNWDEPKEILSASEGFVNISCPCVTKEQNKYILYFTHGIVITGDQKLTEPRKAGFAVSNKPDGEFIEPKQIKIFHKIGDKVGHVGSLRSRIFENRREYWCNRFNHNLSPAISEIISLNFKDNIDLIFHEGIITKSLFDSLNITDAYVLDKANFNNNTFLFFNGRSELKLVKDKYKASNSAISLLIILIINIFLVKEDIYLYIQ